MIELGICLIKKGDITKKPCIKQGYIEIKISDYSADTLPLDLAITSSAILFGAGA